MNLCCTVFFHIEDNYVFVLALPCSFFAALVTFFLVGTHLNTQINKKTGQCDEFYEQNHSLNPPLLFTETAPTDTQQLRVQPHSLSEVNTKL